jgi:hypothetical protein
VMNDKGMSGVLAPHHNFALNASFLLDMNGSRVRRLRTSSSGSQSQVRARREALAGGGRAVGAWLGEWGWMYVCVWRAFVLCRRSRLLGLRPASFSLPGPWRHPPTFACMPPTATLPPCLSRLQVQTGLDGSMMAKYYMLEAGIVDLSCRGGRVGGAGGRAGGWV